MEYRQLQQNPLTGSGKGHEKESALNAKVARMSKDMLTFDEQVRDVKTIDQEGKSPAGW